MPPNLPKKWFREPQLGHWIYAVDRFAADSGAAQVILSISAWTGSEQFNRRPPMASLSFSMGAVGYQYESELPQWIRDRMMVLNVADAGVHIPQVGVRWHEPDAVKPSSQWKAPRAYSKENIVPGRENRWYVLDCLTV